MEDHKASIFLVIRYLADYNNSSRTDLTTSHHSHGHLVISHLASLGIGIYLAHPLFLPLIESLHGGLRFWGVLIVYACSVTTSFIISKSPFKKFFL